MLLRKFWVDSWGLRSFIEELEHFSTEKHVLIERNRTDLRNDDLGVAANFVEPGAEFFRIRNRCAKRNDFYIFGKVKDDFLPNGTAETVSKVVHLIHDHIAQVHEGFRVCVNHVSQDLSGHHDNLGVRVLVGVAGQQANALSAIALNHLGVLLIAQGLNRGCVKDL